MTAQLIIRVKHTGLHQSGRPNTRSVFINDLDVGLESQLRKVSCYVPAGGSVDIPASSRSLLSLASGSIKKFVTAGVLTAEFFVQPAVFNNTTRPVATGYPIGTSIWNSDDNALNFSDGTNWRDSSGNVT